MAAVVVIKVSLARNPAPYTQSPGGDVAGRQRRRVGRRSCWLQHARRQGQQDTRDGTAPPQEYRPPHLWQTAGRPPLPALAYGGQAPGAAGDSVSSLVVSRLVGDRGQATSDRVSRRVPGQGQGPTRREREGERGRERARERESARAREQESERERERASERERESERAIERARDRASERSRERARERARDTEREKVVPRGTS